MGPWHPSLTAGAFKRSGTIVAIVMLAAIAFPHLSAAAPAAPTITSPAAGRTVAGATPTKVSIRGTAPTGSTVDVLDTDAVSLGTASTGTNGAWRLDVAMSDGSHTITAIATDGQGIASSPSDARTFTVDAQQPSVSVAAPAEAHVYQPGQAPRIEGSATDERTIHAIRVEYWRLNSLVVAALATCPGCDDGASSTWTHRPVLPTSGFYLVKVFAYDAAGNRSSAGQTSFATSGVDETPIAPPDIPGAPELPVPSLGTPDRGKTVPAANSPVTFTGRTKRGTIVEIDEQVAGLGTIAVVADEDGNGRWSTSVRLPSGSYGVRLHALDEDGNVSPLSKLIRFSVDAAVPELIGLPEDTMAFLPLQPVVIEGTVLDDRRAAWVVLEYWLADRLELRQLASCPGCPASEAAWSARPNLAKAGYYYVKVRAFDKAGNQSSIATVTFVKTV